MFILTFYLTHANQFNRFELNTIDENFQCCGFMLLVFANGPGDVGSIPGRVKLKSQKMVLGTSWLNSQHYKVRIKGKVEQSRETSSALSYTLV